jgi:ORF6N domain
MSKSGVPKRFHVSVGGRKGRLFKVANRDLKGGRGKHRKYLPHAFTEQGVAMLSSVLNSDRAEPPLSTAPPFWYPQRIGTNPSKG